MKIVETHLLKILETHIVPMQPEPVRIQDYGVDIFLTVSTKSALKKAIKKERILVNGEITSTAKFLYGNEEIILLEDSKKHKHFDLKLEILFEDEHLAIINKPAGVSVSGNSFATIDNALPHNLKSSSEKDAVKPRPAHRLDYPTSGLLIIGKTNSSIRELNLMFENKEIQKTYIAICIGEMNSSGVINESINGKDSVSEYKVLESVSSERFGKLNLVQLSPKTGRKHQLRIHLSHIGNPILGDQQYGKEDLILQGKGLYLHAYQLVFTHPFTKKTIQLNSIPPKKFAKIFDYF